MLHVRGVRRLPAAALRRVQRLQEVRAPQQLHCRARRPEVHELRRSGTRQVLRLLSQTRSPTTLEMSDDTQK